MHSEIIIRFLLAALWGGIVGAEREYRSKSAGFRTLMMISIGSCFFTMMSVLIGQPGNPDRIASNIVTGIGFLGAGVIFRGENRVNGITTAATIWAVAAVGMGIGAGYYYSAAIASVLILIVLTLLPWFESLIDYFNLAKVYKFRFEFTAECKKKYEQVFSKHRLNARIVSETRNGKELSVTWLAHGKSLSHKKFTDEMMQDDSIQYFEY